MAIIGEILTRESFFNLLDFDLKGNWSVSSGKLHTTGGDSILQYKYASALDDFTWKIRTNSTALKIQLFGIKSENNIRTTLSLENGKAKWNFDYDGASGISSSSIIIEPGDVLEFEFSKSEWVSYFTVRNINKNTETVVLLNVAVTANKLRLWSSLALDVISIIKTSNQEYKPLNLLVGDSISYGSSATTANLRWGTIAGFSVEGSAGDTSVEALELLYEIVNIIKPKRVVYAMGTNDIDIEVWKTNLQSFKQYVTQRGIDYIPITPYANSLRNMTAYRDYIVVNFTKYFDIFEVTKQSGNYNIKPEYNAGDNVHYNNLGHGDIGQFVLSSPYYTFTELIKQETSSFFACVLQKWHSLF